MVTVPQAPIARTENRPAITTTQSARGSEDIRAFGGGGNVLDEGLTRLGTSMGQIAEEMQSRDDAIFLVNEDTAYTDSGAASLRTLQTTADLSSPDVVQGYLKQLDDSKTQALSNFKGSGRGRVALENRLAQRRASLANQALGLSFAARSEKMDFTLAQQTARLGSQVRSDPSSIMAAFDQVEQDISDLSPGLTPQQQRVHRQTAQSQLMVSAIEGLIDRGAVDQAEKLLLDTPGADAMFSPSARKQVYDRMRQARATMLAEGKRNAQDVKGIPRDIFDRLSPAQQERVIGAGDDAGGAKTADERMRNTFATNAPEFSTGQMTPTQERRFIADVNAYIQPRRVQDPFTQEWTEQQNKLPGYMVDALHARGIRVPESAIGGLESPRKPGTLETPQVTIPQAQPAAGAGGTEGVVEQPAAAPQQTGAANQPEAVQQPQLSPADQPAQVPAEVAGDETVQTVANNPVFEGLDPALFAGGTTIAEMGEVFTGPKSAVKDFIGRMPFFGTGGGEATSTRRTLPLVFRRLVAAMQTNPRFAEGERESIAKEISAEPELWANETAFLEDMVGIDRALEFWQKNSEEALKGKISADQRRHELNTLQQIQAFRQVLLPPRLESDAQEVEFERSNPPGTRVLVKRNDKWVFGRVQ
jgi:hypothetical protein